MEHWKEEVDSKVQTGGGGGKRISYPDVGPTPTTKGGLSLGEVVGLKKLGLQ